MRAATGAVLAAALLGGCGGGDDGAPSRTDRRVPPAATGVAAALAPLPGGGVRTGDLTTGVVRDLDARGRPAGPVRITLPVSTGGQRGLLGLAVDARGRTFAAFTARGGARRLVVEQVLPGPRRRVWTGPPSTDLADGGHLVLRRGRLVLGVGDLQAPVRTAEPDAPNGKLLALDPDGAADQTPQVLSRGWNNPYAFTVAADGSLLVADNAPGRRPERIARGDTGGGPPRAVTDLAGRIAPSGIVALGADGAAVCGVRSGRLHRLRRRGGRWRPAGTLGPCAYGVVRLAGGRLAVSGADGVRVVAAP